VSVGYHERIARKHCLKIPSINGAAKLQSETYTVVTWFGVPGFKRPPQSAATSSSAWLLLFETTTAKPINYIGFLSHSFPHEVQRFQLTQNCVQLHLIGLVDLLFSSSIRGTSFPNPALAKPGRDSTRRDIAPRATHPRGNLGSLGGLQREGSTGLGRGPMTCNLLSQVLQPASAQLVFHRLDPHRISGLTKPG